MRSDPEFQRVLSLCSVAENQGNVNSERKWILICIEATTIHG